MKRVTHTLVWLFHRNELMQGVRAVVATTDLCNDMKTNTHGETAPDKCQAGSPSSPQP